MDILGELVEVKIILSNKEGLFAKVVWIFEKAELKWGRITPSKFGDEKWVQLPKFHIGNGYVTPLKILDKTTEEYLQQKAIDAYGQALFEQSKDEIDISEIDL